MPAPARVIVVLAAAFVLTIACGHKGPPLPPLVRIPAAPAEMTIARRGDTVELQFIVSATNTDGTRPANVERIDVYAFTGPDVPDEDVLKREWKVATVRVKAPRDPNATVEPDESIDDLDPLEGAGLDQGAKARVQEKLTAASLAPFEAAKAKAKKQSASENDTHARPLLGPPPGLMRTYVAVGVNKSGRKGAISARVRVPLVPPPAPPRSPPAVTYDETAITVSWVAPSVPQRQEPATGDILPSTPIGFSTPAIAYHVYELPPHAPTPVASGASGSDGSGERRDAAPETRLTESPIKETTYTDKRIVWGAERCYAVRTVEIVGDLTIESEAQPASCRKLVDTFPPAAPKGLTAVPNQRAISLIWEPNAEKDLGGYILLRGTTADKLEPVLSAPIQETSYTDTVPAGARYFYAVKAVDKAGNASAASAPEEATARE